MDRNQEKLAKFSGMVTQDAVRKKSELIKQAEIDKKEYIAASENQFLKQAYEKIQDAVRRLDKEINEEVSKAILESKQALFNRRDEIIDLVFQNVKDRLIAFRATAGYGAFLESKVKHALAEAGEGEIVLIAEADDIKLLETIKTNIRAGYRIDESDEPIIGGFLIMNREKGFIWDHTLLNRMHEERSTFLEKFVLSIE